MSVTGQQENAAIGLALYQALTGAAAVAAQVGDRVCEDQAPQPNEPGQAGDGFPHIVFASQGGSDVGAVGAGQRILFDGVYLVKGVTRQSSYILADQIAAALDAVVQDLAATVEVDGVDYYVRSAGRVGPVRYPERTDGVDYRHSGGRYRIVCQAI